MVNNDNQQLNQIFSALSDPTRRAILSSLADKEMSVTDLSQPFNISKSAITKHLKILESSGLLSRTIEGRVHRCRLEPKPLAAISEWVSFYERFWTNKFDALDAYLAKENK